MRWICAFVMVVVMQAAGSQFMNSELIAKDSIGVVVQTKEKYGGYSLDTCTVVMLHNNYFVLVYREGASRWIPATFHSVSVVARLSDSKSETLQPMAALKNEERLTSLGSF